MKYSSCALVLVLVTVLGLVGCKKESTTASTTPPPPATPTAPSDSHVKVASDLLAVSKEFTQVLAGIQNATDAKAAAAKMEDLAARHEAIAARATALPPPSASEESEVKSSVEPDFIKEGARVTEQLRQLFHDDEVKKVLLPYVQRMGGAVQTVAATSHLNPTDPKQDKSAGVVRDPAARKRISDLARMQKTVPVPPELQNVRAGKEYAANVAPLIRDYGPEKVVAVKFANVPSTDNEFMPRLFTTGQKLQKAGSNPVTVPVDRTTFNYFVAYAPVSDLTDLAKKLTDLNPGTTSSVDTAVRMITITRGAANVPGQ